MTPSSATPPANQGRGRALVASLTGSSIEWFDYFLYGTAAALVFNKLFFPTFDPVVGLLLAYLSFSLTFFVRPIGVFCSPISATASGARRLWSSPCR
ncbi:MHS family MFS transporter [Pseudomonas sp. S31]|uniref:hypothetical protein n=1 Tax=Pseudomonas sp. S31 TaxID=1564473 RepID=UPI001914648D|nr:hypothetical protein [Pseudomonas sp. S31]MBK5002346.1 MHS family MFS transporter [Pseudomonas sp. S31]